MKPAIKFMNSHSKIASDIRRNDTAQAAEQDPLSDEYVNAVIRQHGYHSPEAVIARLGRWIGLNGGENSITLLMYEAHKALSKLRAEGVQAGVQLMRPETISPPACKTARTARASSAASCLAITATTKDCAKRWNPATGTSRRSGTPAPPWQAPL